eukprot:352298-Chlamydomonas_euryale.AAC.2
MTARTRGGLQGWLDEEVGKVQKRRRSRSRTQGWRDFFLPKAPLPFTHTHTCRHTWYAGPDPRASGATMTQPAAVGRGRAPGVARPLLPPPSTHTHTPAATPDPQVLRHRDAAGLPPAEGDPWASRELHIKWKRYSHIHCSWDTRDTLSQLPGYKRVLNYMKRADELEAMRPYLSREEQVGTCGMWAGGHVWNVGRWARVECVQCGQVWNVGRWALNAEQVGACAMTAAAVAAVAASPWGFVAWRGERFQRLGLKWRQAGGLAVPSGQLKQGRVFIRIGPFSSVGPRHHRIGHSNALHETGVPSTSAAGTTSAAGAYPQPLWSCPPHSQTAPHRALRPPPLC